MAKDTGKGAVDEDYKEEKLPDVIMPQCAHHKVLAGQKALVTGANSGIDGGMTLYPGFSEGG